MEIGTLLNLPVKVDYTIQDDTHRITLINEINGLELATFESNSVINSWGNPGGYYTKEQWDKLHKEQDSEQ